MQELNCGSSSQYSLTTASEYLEKKVAELLEALTGELDGIGVCTILHPADTESMFLSSIYRLYTKINYVLSHHTNLTQFGLCSPTSAQSGWKSVRESSPPLCATGLFLDHAESIHTGVGCGVLNAMLFPYSGSSLACPFWALKSIPLRHFCDCLTWLSTAFWCHPAVPCHHFHVIYHHLNCIFLTTHTVCMDKKMIFGVYQQKRLNFICWVAQQYSWYLDNTCQAKSYLMDNRFQIHSQP